MGSKVRFSSAALAMLIGLQVCVQAATQFPSEPEIPEVVRPVRIATLPLGSSIVQRHGMAVVWSPDGTRAAWVAERNGQLLPMWTTREGLQLGRPHEQINLPAFSDDSEHVVFTVGNADGDKKERWSILLNGELDGKYDWLGGAHFWPNTTEVVCWSRPGARLDERGFSEGGAYVLQVGRRKGKKWTDVEQAGPRGGLTYAADGSRAAVAVAKGVNWSALLIGERGQSADGLKVDALRDMAISGDGKHWAAAVVRPSLNNLRPGAGALINWVIRRGDEELGDRYESVDMPVFAPSESRLAYRVKSEGKASVVIEGGAPARLVYQAVDEIVWEPPGISTSFALGEEGLAFIAALPPAPSAANPDLMTWQVVRYDGAGNPISKGEAFVEIRDLVIAPGGVSDLNLAYCVRAKDNGPWRLVREWTEAGDVRFAISDAFDFMGPPIWTEAGFRAGVVDGDDILLVQTRDR